MNYWQLWHHLIMNLFVSDSNDDVYQTKRQLWTRWFGDDYIMNNNNNNVVLANLFNLYLSDSDMSFLLPGLYFINFDCVMSQTSWLFLQDLCLEEKTVFTTFTLELQVLTCWTSVETSPWSAWGSEQTGWGRWGMWGWKVWSSWWGQVGPSSTSWGDPVLQPRMLVQAENHGMSLGGQVRDSLNGCFQKILLRIQHCMIPTIFTVTTLVLISHRSGK